MAPQFDALRNYTLLQAFDQLGQRLYGSDWSGLEAWATPDTFATELRKQRADLLARIEALELEIERQRKKAERTDSDAERDQLHAALHNLSRDLEAAEMKRRELPRLSDSPTRDDERFMRRDVVERKLFDAVRDRALTMLYGPSTIVEWDHWVRAGNFQVITPLSMGVVSTRIVGQRRAPLFIHRDEFEKWLRAVDPDLLNPDSKASRRLRFIDELRAAFAAGEPKGQRAKWMGRAKEYGLSKREAESAWTETVPEAMRSGGRPKSSH